MTNELLADGKTYQLDVTREGRVDKYPMDFGRADRLDIFGNYQFFTPAPLYLYGGLTDHTWTQLMQEANRDITLMFYKFDSHVFRGLDAANGDKDWNHALWAVTKDDWALIEPYLLSLVFMDKPKKQVHKIGAQDLQILDPLYIDTKKIVSPSTPRIDIVAFGVNGNKRCVAFDLETAPPLLRFLDPQEKIVRFADKLFGGLDNTQAAAENMETPREN